MIDLLLTPEILIFLFVVSVAAGCIDTLAGGGGLITLPALIVCGVPPLYALGTNKLQGSMGTATASLMMLRKRRVEWQSVKQPMLTAFIGSTCGTIAVQFIDASLLDFIIPIILLLIAIYFLVSPVPQEGRAPKISSRSYQFSVIPAIGWYDGMFGPGTGSFFALAGVSLRGKGLVESTATAKTLNFATNISSLMVFLLAGKVAWLLGLLMMLGQLIGAWAGSHILFRINPNYLRILVVLMCSAMLVRYFFT